MGFAKLNILLGEHLSGAVLRRSNFDVYYAVFYRSASIVLNIVMRLTPVVALLFAALGVFNPTLFGFLMAVWAVSIPKPLAVSFQIHKIGKRLDALKGNLPTRSTSRLAAGVGNCF